MKAKHHRTIRIVLVTIVALVWTASAVVAGDRMPDSAAESRGSLDIDRLATEKVTMTIKTKEHDKIKTKFWDFFVTDRTEFVTKKGNLISFNDFRVPCKAVIQYEPSNGVQRDRTAWRVVIKKVSKSATDNFSEPEGY